MSLMIFIPSWCQRECELCLHPSCEEKWQRCPVGQHGQFDRFGGCNRRGATLFRSIQSWRRDRRRECRVLERPHWSQSKLDICSWQKSKERTLVVAFVNFINLLGWALSYLWSIPMHGDTLVLKFLGESASQEVDCSLPIRENQGLSSVVYSDVKSLKDLIKLWVLIL